MWSGARRGVARVVVGGAGRAARQRKRGLDSYDVMVSGGGGVWGLKLAVGDARSSKAVMELLGARLAY